MQYVAQVAHPKNLQTQMSLDLKLSVRRFYVFLGEHLELSTCGPWNNRTNAAVLVAIISLAIEILPINVQRAGCYGFSEHQVVARTKSYGFRSPVVIMFEYTRHTYKLF